MKKFLVVLAVFVLSASFVLAANLILVPGFVSASAAMMPEFPTIGAGLALVGACLYMYRKQKRK